MRGVSTRFFSDSYTLNNVPCTTSTAKTFFSTEMWADAAVYNGLIYVFGGSSNHYNDPWAAYKSVYAYDPQTDTWTRKKDMITGRLAHQTFLVDGKIYAIGGSAGSGVFAAVEMYDPANDNWQSLTEMPKGYMCSAGAVVNDKIYVIGGTSNWATGVSDVWEYDPRVPPTSVEKHPEAVPNVFVLEQNYPNPFNPSTTIQFELPRSLFVKLSVYDALGGEVSTLVNERKEKGIHQVRFDGMGFSSGVYFYRLQAGEVWQTGKMLLVR